MVDNIPPLPPAGETQGTSLPGPAPSGPAPRDGAGGGDLPFTLGQHLFARVVQVISERAAVIELGGQRLMTSTPEQVSPDQVLSVAVRGLGPVVELELL